MSSRNPFIVRKLKAYEQDHEDDAGERHREPDEIDEAVQLVAREAPQRHGEIVSEHECASSIHASARVLGWPAPAAGYSHTPSPRRSAVRPLRPRGNIGD